MHSQKRIFVLICASALATGLAGTCEAASAAFNAAAALYNQHKYADAARAFAAVLKAEPQNATAGLYLANSYMGAGQARQAQYYYTWLVSSFPRGAEATTARNMLTRLGVTPPSPSMALPSAVEPPAGGSGAVPTAQAAPASASVDVNSMFSVVRPLGDHPYCSKEFIAMVKAAIHRCPKQVVEYVASKGCKICITPTLIDRNPELKNSKPRGYEEGHTYKNTPAMFDAPEVVVCQYALIGENGDTWEPMQGAVGALRHEFGHAVDHFLGMASYDEKFRHIYYLDRAKIEAEDKEALNYYIQPGTEEGGPSECYAQACCIIFGGDTEDWRKRVDVKFERAFPNVIQYVRKQLDSL